MIRFASLFSIALVYTLWAQAAPAQVSTDDLASRMNRLEAAVRDLTGSVEELQHRNQQLEQEVRRLETGAASPPAAAPYSTPASVAAIPPGVPGAPAAGAGPGPMPPQPSASPAGGRSDAFNPALHPTAPGVPRPLGASTTANEPPPIYEPRASASQPDSGATGVPLDLSARSPSGGELPPPPPSTPSATGAVQATLPPTNTPQDEYELAYGYVLHRDYGLAANTFRSFLRQYPSDRMTPEAQYWLGESLFQQRLYREAAESFLTVATKYETTARAPQALLRLGQSLAALGEKEAACASLGEVMHKYPHAALNIRQSVEREQRRVRC